MNNLGPLVRAHSVERLFISQAETVRAVDKVDLEARSGEFICLFGHSGSGKTTLLNLMAGLDVPTAGGLEVAGCDISSASEHKRIKLRRETIGMVHQSHLLIEEFSAAENVALPLEARGFPTEVALKEAATLLESVGLGGYENRYPEQLSGGQRQRVGIARALSGDRKILLADEPSGSLDSVTGAAVFDLLRVIADGGALVIVASHDPACRDRATRTIEMLDGRVKRDECLR